MTRKLVDVHLRYIGGAGAGRFMVLGIRFCVGNADSGRSRCQMCRCLYMNRESSWRQANPENSAPASPDPGAFLEED